MEQPTDNLSIAEACWQECDKFLIGETPYLSGILLAHHLVEKGFSVRIATQIPRLSYFPNGIICEENLPEYLTTMLSDNTVTLSEGETLGEDILCAMQPSDLEAHPANIALLLTALKAHPHALFPREARFLLDSDRGNPGAYRPFRSFAAYSSREEAMEAILVEARQPLNLWTRAHKYPLPGNLPEGFTVGAVPSPEQERHLSRLESALAKAPRHAAGKIEARLEEIRSRPPESFGYIPAIQWHE